MTAPFGSNRRAIAAGIYFVMVALFSFLAQSGGSVADAAAPAFTSQESDLVIEGIPGRATFILKADNLDAATLAKPLGDITDVGSPTPPNLILKFIARELDQSTSSRRWIVTVEVAGPLLPNVIQRRYAKIPFDGKESLVAYTLTHKPLAFTWNVKGPAAELALPPDRSMAVTVITQNVAATNVRIGQALLYEQSRRHEMPGRLALCPEPTGACQPSRTDVDPLTSKRLWLRPTTDDAIVGKYVGTVNIVSDQKPEGETINLTIYGTTWCKQALGVLVIFLGVVAAWITTTWNQNRLNRAQLLLPAASLATRAGELHDKLLAAPKGDDVANVTNTLSGLKEIISALSEATLETKRFIPSKWPNPAKSNVGSIEPYKQYLAEFGSNLAILAVYVDEGFVRIWQEATGTNDPRIKHFRNASRSLDSLLSRTPPPATTKEVRDQIQIIYTQLQTDLTGAAPPPNAVLAALVPQPLSYEKIVVEIRQLSLMTWTIFGLLATALGAYVLVFTNLGFGISTDYFVCLFWGFGLPAGGQQLAQSTLGSARTAVGIAVP
jgi:hypothetical protein